MTDHATLRELAKKAGGEEWTASDGIVWFADGDSALQTAKNPSAVFLAYTNLGHWPDMLLEEDVAAFAGAANPARVIALLDEIDRLNAEWMAKCEELRKDAERFRAMMSNHWLRASKYYDGVYGWESKFISAVDAEVVWRDAAMAKKEGA